MLIDSHHHLWRYSAEQYSWISDEMSILRQDFWTPQLQDLAARESIDGFVCVQARQTLQETEQLIQLAEAEPLIRGVVGWVPLASSSVSEAIDQFASSPLLKAVRHVVQDEPDERFLLGSEFNRGIKRLRDHDLVYDLLIFAHQLPAAIQFVDRHPEQRFVLDHLAKPTIRHDAFDEEWEKRFRELARRDNVCCKFSGVVTEVRGGDWTPETIRRYYDVALDSFSIERLMFGSDWPVCLLKTEYADWIRTTQELTTQLSPSQREDFFANNAIATYKL